VNAGVEGGSDEGVPQGVRPDLLGQAGSAGDAADDPPGAVAASGISAADAARLKPYDM
jgi:hypothetical protein